MNVPAHHDDNDDGFFRHLERRRGAIKGQNFFTPHCIAFLVASVHVHIQHSFHGIIVIVTIMKMIAKLKLLFCCWKGKLLLVIGK